MNNNQQYTEGFSENNGVKIFYRDYGPEDGDPVLMVHGLGAQLVHWQPHLISFLQANNFRPIAYDNRDVGLSSRFAATSCWRRTIGPSLASQPNSMGLLLSGRKA